MEAMLLGGDTVEGVTTTSRHEGEVRRKTKPLDGVRRAHQ